MLRARFHHLFLCSCVDTFQRSKIKAWRDLPGGLEFERCSCKSQRQSQELGHIDAESEENDLSKMQEKTLRQHT